MRTKTNMRKRLYSVVFATISTMALNTVYASQITGEVLSENCQELIAIYNKKGDQRLFAGMSTSISEAMRAGICRGMIEEHTNHFRCARGWHDMAKVIAAKMGSQYSAEEMLELSCGN